MVENYIIPIAAIILLVMLWLFIGKCLGHCCRPTPPPPKRSDRIKKYRKLVEEVKKIKRAEDMAKKGWKNEQG